MPSKATLYEAYWKDVERRCLDADKNAMFALRAARRLNERAAKPHLEDAKRWRNRAERLDMLGVMVVGRLFHGR